MSCLSWRFLIYSYLSFIPYPLLYLLFVPYLSLLPSLISSFFFCLIQLQLKVKQTSNSVNVIVYCFWCHFRFDTLLLLFTSLYLHTFADVYMFVILFFSHLSVHLVSPTNSSTNSSTPTHLLLSVNRTDKLYQPPISNWQSLITLPN